MIKVFKKLGIILIAILGIIIIISFINHRIKLHKEVKEKAKKVKEGGIPIDIPIYFFISDGKEVAVSSWGELLSAYSDKLENGKYMYLDCGHYVHNYEEGIIAEESIKFIDEIIK